MMQETQGLSPRVRRKCRGYPSRVQIQIWWGVNASGSVPILGIVGSVPILVAVRWLGGLIVW